MNLVFIETTDGIVFDFFSAWQDAVMNMKTGKGNNKELVSAIVNLTLIDNNDNAMRLFTIWGCILKGYNRGKADNSDEIFKADITLGFDYFTETKADLVGTLSTLSGVTEYFTGKVPEWLKF